MIPRFRIYNAAATELLHTFELVQNTNLPQTPRNIVEITGVRGKGSIIIDGGEAPWDVFIEGVLTSKLKGWHAYKELTSKVDAMESAVAVDTPLILTLHKTESTFYQYKVKRIEPISYPPSNRVFRQDYRVNLRVNCW
jgi:hypothetical protein